MDLSFLPKQFTEDDDTDTFLETCYSPKEIDKITKAFNLFIYNEIGDLYHPHLEDE